MMMWRLCLSAIALTVALASAPLCGASAAPTERGDFAKFLAKLWPDAQAKGVTRATFDAAFAGLTPDPRVIAATQKQPEYGKPVGAYVNAVASTERIATGLAKAAEWADTFAAVEQRFAVERWIILGIWGIETSYGADKDRWDVIRSLATLAQAGYRDPYFRTELIVALKMMQEGQLRRDRIVGSWSGAMGQPQFMPSNFYDFAVRFSGDGWGDIWTNVPDVLASTANYLRKEGWNAQLPWGFEIVVPGGFDYGRSRASFGEWAASGFKRADDRAFPAAGEAILFFPTGASGPAFLVTENFVVLKRYNDSDVYALAVGHLADRIRGLGPIRAAWPPEDRQLSRDERIAVQRKLAELGYAVRDFEGHFDFELRDAIRAVQVQLGMRPDGHPTTALLARLGELRR
jgi:membrane-bound lytic murein transglycosylase B